MELPFPLHVDAAADASVRSLDFICVDVNHPEGTAAVAYLHGAYVPMLRLARGPAPSEAPDLERTLFSAFEKGYSKHIVRFNGAAELKAGLAGRGAALRRESRRIATEAAAVEYFGQSAVRKRKVFISYASEDREAAAPFIAAFQGKFESVFNYKDTGMSIPLGTDWTPSIEQAIRETDLGVLMLSSSYLGKGTCQAELKALVERRLGGGLPLLPVKLHAGLTGIPEFVKSIQYADMPDPNWTVEKVVAQSISLLGA